MTQGLKKVTFINTGRFAYGTIDLSGNTLLTGTNGSGKTTTNQSILFFYGNANRGQLGISKSDGKLGWSKYMFPFPNSYIFYRYTGIYGDVLVMTYAYSTANAWRFIPIDDGREPDIEAIVFDNGVPRSPSDIVNLFTLAGFKPSTQITDRQMYRRILYGDIDYRKEKELAPFRRFAMMEAPKYFQHIPDMQSSIFISSKIGDGSIEKAITSGYGMQSSLPLAQIRGQLQDVTEQFEAISVYSQRSDDILKMKTYAKQYREGTELVASLLRQLMANREWMEKEAATLEILISDAEAERSKKLEAFETELSLFEDEYRRALSIKIELEQTLKDAIGRKERYAKYDMISMSAEVDLLPTIEAEKGQKRAEYESSLGGANGISETYEKLLKAEADGLAEQIRSNSELFDRQKADIETQKEAIVAEYEQRNAELDSKYESDTAELKTALFEADTISREAFKNKTIIESRNPYLDEVESLKNAISEIKQAIETGKRESEHFGRHIDALGRQREELERRIESVSSDAARRFDIEKKPFESEIKTLQAKLEASEETVLGLIRRDLPEMESVLASLLKDEILLSTEIAPSVVDIQPSAYGLMFETNLLPESDITREAITAKISAIARNISALQRQIAEEADAKVVLINKEKGDIQKEIYSAKSKKDGADEMLAKNSSKLLSLQEDFLMAETSSSLKWEDEKAEAAKKHKEVHDRYEAIKTKYDEAGQRLKETKGEIKAQYAEKTNRLSVALNDMRTELNNKNADAKSRSQEATRGIESRRDEALSEGGFSPARINEMKRMWEEAEERYAAAIKNVGLVATWRDDKPKIDNIPAYEKSYMEASDSVSLIDERSNKRKVEINAEKTLIDTTITDMIRKKDNYTMQAKDAGNTLNSFNFRALIESMDKTELPPYNAEPSATISANATIANNKRFEFSKIAQMSLQKFLSHIPDRYRTTFFECDLSSAESSIVSIEQLGEFVESGGLDGMKESIATRVRVIQQEMSSYLEEFNSETKTIDALVQRIDKGLKRAIEKIQILDDLGIRVVHNEHRIFRDLENIASVDIPYGDTKSLFAEPGKSAKSSAEILEYFAHLLKHLDDEKADDLTIADTIEVQFKIVENGNLSDWSSLKSSVGSTGTGVIVKTLTYVALLNAVMELTQRGERTPIHVMLDEIGTLDQNNMREIIDFANENSIYFLNAAPDIKLPDRYSNLYLYRLDKGKTKIIPLAVKV